MRVGLVDIDGGHHKKQFGATAYPNLALGKIARYHRGRGDDVEWAFPLAHYDRLYMSKVFNFTQDDMTAYNADEIVKGGTGYDISSRLPDEIDRLQPDYSMFPYLPKDTAYGFLTRGCPNRCPWCVVPRKEGRIRPYMDADEIAIEGRKKLVLMDNNILAAGDYAVGQLRKIIDRGYRVDFNQAMDARLVTDEYARLLARVRWITFIRFGCDTPAQIEHCVRATEAIASYGYRGRFFLYTMIGGKSDFRESYGRVNFWRERMLKARDEHRGGHANPYAQPYRDPDDPSAEIPQWQKDLATWVNNKARFYAHPFSEFEPRKGFKCIKYLEQYGMV